MSWLPPASVEMLNCAVPEASAIVPRVAAPSLKLTVPVGAAAGGVTVADTSARKVTSSVKPDGFRNEITLAVGVRLFTVCVIPGEVLPLKFASPA
jgi:hypothetical protein